MIAMERQEETDNASPRIMARGHLALLDWERSSEEETMQTISIHHADPIRHTPFDRLFDKGLLLLLVATIAAVCACMAHL